MRRNGNDSADLFADLVRCSICLKKLEKSSQIGTHLPISLDCALAAGPARRDLAEISRLVRQRSNTEP
jgi:hypothetical protein